MRTFGEMVIVARHSDNTVMFIGFSDHHEKDVYKFLSPQTKKPIFVRCVIWPHMGFTASEEEEIIGIKDNEIEEEEGLFGSPQLMRIR
jgi:hypothetical protein